nr:cell wall hydrolase [uncultured Aminipila sp.]
MNKTKGMRLIFFVSILTFSIALFLYASTAFTQNNSDSEGQGSKLSKSETNIAMKNTSDSSSSNMKQLSDDSSEGYADERMTFFNGQTGDEGTVISRGLTSRDTYYKEKQRKEPVKPSAASVAPTEVKKIESPQSTQAEAKENEVPQSTQAEVKKIQVQQSTQEKADSQYENDLGLLARLITAEAQGEPYEAKVAVGAVVINRVNSGVWAHTIKGVIYQNINGYYQFTPVANGWINKPAEPESIQAAEAAMNGSDPTSGAQFYYDDKATNAWILSKPISVQIGHMIYAY